MKNCIAPASAIVLFLLTLIPAAASFSLAFAEGPPVDRETRQVSVPHTLIELDAAQVEEFDTLETVTFSPEQWASLREEAPSCPKRLDRIIPWDLNDCTCGLLSYTYGIVITPTRLAVIHGEWRSRSLAYELIGEEFAGLRMDRKGELYLDGSPVSFPILLEAISRDQDAIRPRSKRRGPQAPDR